MLWVGVFAATAAAGYLVVNRLTVVTPPLADVRLLDLYRETGRVYFQVEGTKVTNEALGGIYISWRFSDLTMLAGEPLENADGEVLTTAARVAGEHFVSRPFRVAIDGPGQRRVSERLETDPGAMLRICFTYPGGALALQCFETPAAEIMEGAPPIPGISLTRPIVTTPRPLY